VEAVAATGTRGLWRKGRKEVQEEVARARGMEGGERR
jgi:hypothetical protein